jgi:hypothetical protein
LSCYVFEKHTFRRLSAPLGNSLNPHRRTVESPRCSALQFFGFYQQLREVNQITVSNAIF